MIQKYNNLNKKLKILELNGKKRKFYNKMMLMNWLNKFKIVN